MKRAAAGAASGNYERFPVEAGVPGLSEEWAARALAALRAAVVSRQQWAGGGEERGGGLVYGPRAGRRDGQGERIRGQ